VSVVQLERTFDIDAPPETVWAVISDVERWHEWTESITSVRLLDAAPLRVGSRAKIKQPRFPAIVWTVTSLDPGRSFTWEARTLGAHTIGRHSVVARTGGGSTATLALVQTGWLARLIAPWTDPISRRYVEMEAEGLKRRCESRR
jgi:uncharacterized membrane protein